MRRHDDGEPVAGEAGDHQRQLDPAGDVEKRRWLVEDEHGRLLGEGTGDEDALTLTIRELGERPMPHPIDPETGSGRMRDSFVLGRQIAAPARVRVPSEEHDVADGQQSWIDAVSEHDGDLAGPLDPVEAVQLSAVEEHLAGEWPLTADERPQQRRLAAAVGADHCRQLPGGGGQRGNLEHRE